MSKRIALIMERADIMRGGAERSVFDLRHALTEIGLEAEIIAATKATDAPYVHALCKDGRGKRVPYWTFARKLKIFLSKHRYDIIHSVLPFEFAHIYQPRGGTYRETISRTAASYQSKLVGSYKKKTAPTNFRRAAFLRAERKLCANQEGPLVVAISNYVTEQFRKYYCLADERIIRIYNGVKTDECADKQQANRLLRKVQKKFQLKESDDPVLFLFAATNPRLKGLKPLLEALSLVSRVEVGKSVYLVVAGLEKKKKQRKYLRMARKLGVEHKVAFVGFVPHIQDALSITDVAVLPTFYDPASRFILEAIVEKKPVITTRYNGAAELFVDGRHGRVLDRPENTEALAEAIIHFTDGDNIRKAQEAIVTDNLKEKVSISNVAKALDNLYEKIVNSGGATVDLSGLGRT